MIHVQCASQCPCNADPLVLHTNGRMHFDNLLPKKKTSHVPEKNARIIFLAKGGAEVRRGGLAGCLLRMLKRRPSVSAGFDTHPKSSCCETLFAPIVGPPARNTSPDGGCCTQDACTRTNIDHLDFSHFRASLVPAHFCWRQKIFGCFSCYLSRGL